MTCTGAVPPHLALEVARVPHLTSELSEPLQQHRGRTGDRGCCPLGGVVGREEEEVAERGDAHQGLDHHVDKVRVLDVIEAHLTDSGSTMWGVSAVPMSIEQATRDSK